MIKDFSLTILIFLLTSLFSCDNSAIEKKNINNADSISDPRSMSDTRLPADSLKKRILELGDTNAYNYLRMDLLLELPDEEAIKWSKIMVDKYVYPVACTDYFQTVIGTCNPPSLECLDKNEKDTAILILNKAVFKGDSLATKLKSEYVK